MPASGNQNGPPHEATGQSNREVQGRVAAPAALARSANYSPKRRGNRMLSVRPCIRWFFAPDTVR